MKDFHLRFCLEARGWPTATLFDLLADGLYEMPETGGAYVLGTSDGTMLTYPWGASPVFYIGKGNNLRQRLATHQKAILGAREDHELNWWWPRYQYGAAFGATCAYYSRKGPEPAQNVEALLVEEFYRAYGAIPAANSEWPSRIKPKHD